MPVSRHGSANANFPVTARGTTCPGGGHRLDGHVVGERSGAPGVEASQPLLDDQVATAAFGQYRSQVAHGRRVVLDAHGVLASAAPARLDHHGIVEVGDARRSGRHRGASVDAHEPGSRHAGPGEGLTLDHLVGKAQNDLGGVGLESEGRGEQCRPEELAVGEGQHAVHAVRGQFGGDVVDGAPGHIHHRAQPWQQS